MKKYLEYAGIVIVALVLAIFLVPKLGAERSLGLSTAYDSVNVSPSSATGDSYAYAVSGTPVFDLNGHLTAAAGNCGTQAWNPSSVGSTTVSQVDVAVANYVVGDEIDSATLATSTQGLGLLAVTTSTNGFVTAILFDPDNTGAAIDIGTTSIMVCTAH